MRKTDLYPLKLQPSFHVKVWGGNKLSALLHKQLPTDEPYGEAWELHDNCVVANGTLAGKSLGELTKIYGKGLVGDGNDVADGFPLLAKFIDADQWLSVQVHPDDRQAQELEDEPRGKTEAWVIIDAEPNARLVIGFKPGITRATVEQAIRRNLLESHLVYVQVRAGDVLYIPANTVHALGPGLLIYEIQQASDTTYRLYDWGRMGLDGKPRQLHIEKGLQVSNLKSLPQVKRPSDDLIIDGDYFQTWRHHLRSDALQLESESGFQALTCIDGALRVGVEGAEAIDLTIGETCLVPASLPIFTIHGLGTVLRSCQKNPHSPTG